MIKQNRQKQFCHYVLGLSVIASLTLSMQTIPGTPPTPAQAAEAFMRVTHPRLGEPSPAQKVPTWLLREIVELARVKNITFCNADTNPLLVTIKDKNFLWQGFLMYNEPVLVQNVPISELNIIVRAVNFNDWTRYTANKFLRQEEVPPLRAADIPNFPRMGLSFDPAFSGPITRDLVNISQYIRCAPNSVTLFPARAMLNPQGCPRGGDYVGFFYLQLVPGQPGVF